jgi:hypothetical protein
MRIVLSLILSLVLAAAFCLIMMAAGVLEFKGNGVVAKLKPMGKKVLSRATTQLNVAPTVDEDTSPLIGQKTSVLQPAADKTSLAPPVVAVSVPNTQPSADHDGFVHTRALAFLSGIAGKDGANIEDRFAMFLTQELGVGYMERERLIRMSFWKNFVTLQRPWRAGQRDEMRLAFAREKELKQAGFATKGLTLMASGVQEAEERLEELLQRLSEGAREGEKL